jgi:hypothetical protein
MVVRSSQHECYQALYFGNQLLRKPRLTEPEHPRIPWALKYVLRIQLSIRF